MGILGALGFAYTCMTIIRQLQILGQKQIPSDHVISCLPMARMKLKHWQSSFIYIFGVLGRNNKFHIFLGYTLQVMPILVQVVLYLN